KLRQDAVAGLTVGLMVIPQGLAYAHVAELPVQYGLYSAFMGPFVYCLLGTSKDASLGPPPSCRCSPPPTTRLRESRRTVYAVLMCFACGIVQFLLLGAMRLGVIVNFISLPVVSGFTTSAAVTIAWSQVKSLLGLRGISNWLPLSVYEICRDIGRTKVWDLTLGLSCMALLLVLMKIQRDISKASRIDATEDGDVHLGVRSSRAFLAIVCSGRNALIVACASLVAFSLKSVDLGDKLTLTQKVDSRLPPFRPPAFQLMNGTQVVRDFWQIVGDIGIGFAVVPFIGLVESIAIARVFARSGNYRIDASQELIAIGLSNLAGSFVSSYPVTGSFTRLGC
uniref:Sulfate_transp domain-containing protein n=1 Tax=Macrostomum lignano TaxID=282301 RepID=A0A1I8IYD8_9PLAT